MKRRVFKTILVAALCASLVMPTAAFADYSGPAAQITAEEDAAGGAEVTPEDQIEVSETESEAAAETEVETETEIESETETETETESETETETETESETETETETEAPELLNGLVKDESGALYYYTDGQAYNKGLKTVEENGKKYYYYFQADGKAYTDGVLSFVHTNGNRYIYYFQTSGKAYTKGIKTSSRYATAGSDCKVKKSSDTNKYKYYFRYNGRAYTEGTLKFTDANGDSQTMFFQENGRAFTGGLLGTSKYAKADDSYHVTNADGKAYLYYFQTSGKAYTDGILTVKDADGSSEIYYFQTSGKAYTKGYKSSYKYATASESGKITKKESETKRYYYFQKDATAFKGGTLTFKDSDGANQTYYFLTSGRAYTEGLKSTAKSSAVDENGNITDTSDGSKYYYYFRENGRAKKGLMTFTHTNGKNYTMYFQKDGKAFTDGWKKLSGKKYYFQSNGRAIKGSQTIDGDKYYFSKDGSAFSGWKKIDGEWHYYSPKNYKEKWISNVMHTAWSKIQDRTCEAGYYIVADTTNTRTIVFEDYKGEWVPKYYWLCTPGKASTPTVKGTFTVYGKGYCFGDTYTCYYYTQFHGDYLFHSIIYDHNTFRVQDGRLGQRLSHGCIRLALKNAKWLYDNIPYGTKVLIYGL